MKTYRSVMASLLSFILVSGIVAPEVFATPPAQAVSDAPSPVFAEQAFAARALWESPFFNPFRVRARTFEAISEMPAPLSERWPIRILRAWIQQSTHRELQGLYDLIAQTVHSASPTIPWPETINDRLAGQRDLHDRLNPVLEAWWDERLSGPLASVKRGWWQYVALPSVLGFPSGDEEYKRNLISRQEKPFDVATFIHVLKPHGVIAEHEHEQTWVAAMGLFPGLVNRGYVLEKLLSGPSWDGQVVHLEPTGDVPLVPGQIEGLEAGAESVHRIINTSPRVHPSRLERLLHRLGFKTGYGFLFEVYVGTFHELNYAIPVHGGGGHWGRREETTGFPIPLYKRLLQNAHLVPAAEVVSTLKAYWTGSPRAAFTTQKSALIDLAQAFHYLRTTHANVWQAADGTLVFQPRGTGPTQDGILQKIEEYWAFEKTVVLRSAGGKVISGQVSAIDPEGGHVTLNEARFASADFIRDESGQVQVPLEPRPEVVEGFGPVVRLDRYLQTLPIKSRRRLENLFFNGQESYIATQTALAEQSLAVVQNLPFSRERDLVRSLLTATSEKEVLAALQTTAIADRPSEVIRAARRALMTAVGPTRELWSSLIDLQTQSKKDQDFLSLTSDGLVRTQTYRIPRNQILDTMQQRWGTTTADVVVVGAGPTGIVQALLYAVLGYHVLLVDKSYANVTWADRLNVAVHVLRSPGVRNDAVFASFPVLEKEFGFKNHLPFYRLLAEASRLAVERLLGIPGYASSGLPKDSRALANSADVADALAHSSTRGELFLQLLALLDHAVSKHHLVVLEETPVTTIQSDHEGFHVTLRTDDPIHPELTVLAKHVTLSTGFSGTRGEFARIPDVFERWSKSGSPLIVHDGFEMDQPKVLARMASASPDALMVTSALVGHPAFTEKIRRLPAGTRVRLVGDQESMIKTLKYLSDLHPGLYFDVYMKHEPVETGRHFTAVQNRRLYVEPVLRRPDLHGADRLTDAQRKAGVISPQSMADYRALKSRIIAHVLGKDGFNENTALTLHKEDGPWVLCAGYQDPEERLMSDPMLASLLVNGTLHLDDTVPSLARPDQTVPMIGNASRPLGLTYTGPVVRHMAIAYITGSFGFSWFHALFNALALLKEHQQPAPQAVALHSGRADTILTSEEAALYDLVLSIFHSPDLYRIDPRRTKPSLVYQASVMPADRLSEQKAAIPSVVEDRPEKDRDRLSHLDDALNKELSVEVVPSLKKALARPQAFLAWLYERWNYDGTEASVDLGEQLLALHMLLEDHPDLTLSDIDARLLPSQDRLVMDAADYERLLTSRSETVTVQHFAASAEERFRGEPLLVALLRRAFTWALVGLETPLDVVGRLQRESSPALEPPSLTMKNQASPQAPASAAPGWFSRTPVGPLHETRWSAFFQTSSALRELLTFLGDLQTASPSLGNGWAPWTLSRGSKALLKALFFKDFESEAVLTWTVADPLDPVYDIAGLLIRAVPHDHWFFLNLTSLTLRTPAEILDAVHHARFVVDSVLRGEWQDSYTVHSPQDRHTFERVWPLTKEFSQAA